MEQPGFVCAINGSRDGYQVPAALHQAGLLRRFVTDYYAPENPPHWLPGAMARRRSALLPKAMTAGNAACFVAQHSAERLGLPMNRVFPHTDRMLASQALHEARRRGAHLYCYSSYLPDKARIPAGMRVVDFEYHPLPGLTLDLLREDAARYGEVAWSFERERQHAALERVSESWKHADAVVCASRMTARSLEHAGCEAERITIVPYGFESRPAVARPRATAGPARFLFVGQGVQRKGLHHLLRAWRQIDPARARLTLVCYAIDPGLAELARSTGVELLGRQERASLDALMQSADVFIMPSLIEGFGLAYLEALAAGCHLVGTENTGLPDLPLTDAARTLVPVGNIPALAEAIERLIVLREMGGLDAPGIAAEADNWTWAQFRSRIAEHARSVLA
jgi:glycosyltransferase involved in cell wall biosynthesis